MDLEEEAHVANPSTRVVDVEKQNSESCGFHLTRSKWDPYPWVSKVDEGTAAELAGMQSGECVLEINGEDIVGKRISEIAERVRSGSNHISLLLWNSGVDTRCTPESLCCGSIPQNLHRLSTCMSSILSVMECPVCLETISPPSHQCENGHLVCLKCRRQTERCPVCRIRLSRGRSLLSEQIYNIISDVFALNGETQQVQKTKIQSIFKLNGRKKNIPDIKITQSHTNKFLARLIGKSTSVDNLSNECSKSMQSVKRYPSEDDFGNILKTKSVSTSEIFRTNSACTSRANSFNNINACKYLEKKHLRLDKGSDSSPASYHGSSESIDHKSAVLYPCPYQDSCSAMIKDSHMIEHFQGFHSDPLVQYFQPKLQVPVSIIRTQKNVCYVIHAVCKTFFLRILDTTRTQYKKDSNSNCGVFLWMWILTDMDVCQEFQFSVQIMNTNEEILLGFNSPVHSLSKTPWKAIVDSRRGVFLNLDMLDQFSISVLNIEIQKLNFENNV